MNQVEGLHKPVAQDCAHFVELRLRAGGDALEEVLGTGNGVAVPRRGRCVQDFAEDVGWAELVLVACDEELGLSAGWQKVVGVVPAGGPDGKTEANKGCDAWVSAAGAEGDVGTEREAGKEDGFAVGAFEPGEGGPDVFDFAAAFVVGAFA